MGNMHGVVQSGFLSALLTLALWVELLFIGRSPFGACCAWLVAQKCNGQTWLILPVVICLSQRLSHACLSISFYTAKLRMAH